MYKKITDSESKGEVEEAEEEEETEEKPQTIYKRVKNKNIPSQYKAKEKK